MASRKLLRDSLLSGRSLYSQLKAPQSTSLWNFRFSGSDFRQFSVFNEFSKKMKGEATSNPEFHKSVKELKQKAEELKGVKEDLKVRQLSSCTGKWMASGRRQNLQRKRFLQMLKRNYLLQRRRLTRHLKQENPTLQNRQVALLTLMLEEKAIQHLRIPKISKLALVIT